MDAFPKNVSSLIKRQDTTQQAFADSIGVSLTTVNGWLKRGVQPKRFNLDSICKVYGVTHNDLLSDSQGIYAQLHGLTSAPSGATAVSGTLSRMIPIRVLGTTYAGEPGEPFECCGEAMLYDEMAARHPNAYALCVNGTCMDKVFTDEDYIFVDPDMQPHDGSIAVMLIDGKSETRRVKMGNGSMMLVSESHEPQPDIIIREGDGQEATCQGVVFWWQARHEVG